MTHYTIKTADAEFEGTGFTFGKSDVEATRTNNRQVGYVYRLNGKLQQNYKTLTECVNEVRRIVENETWWKEGSKLVSQECQKTLSEVQGQYVEKMDELYAQQSEKRYLINTPSYMSRWTPEDTIREFAHCFENYKKIDCYADTSIYEDLTGEFYWDNANNTLTDKPRTCETCKHVSWEDGCDITSKHPMCKEVYDAIAAYESLYGEVDFKVAQTCRGYEYHDHCDGEHELPGDFNKASQCQQCEGEGEVEISKPYFDDGRWLPGYQNVECNVCEGTGKA